jgi:hypothetical protein
MTVAYEDVKNEKGVVIAKYLGTDNGPHMWLVMGEADLSAGAITISQVATAGTKFDCYRRAIWLGKRKKIEDAVKLVQENEFKI